MWDGNEGESEGDGNENGWERSMRMGLSEEGMLSENRLATGGGGRGGVRSSVQGKHRRKAASRVAKKVGLIVSFRCSKEKKGATPGGRSCGDPAGGSGVGGTSALVPRVGSPRAMADADTTLSNVLKRNIMLRQGWGHGEGNIPRTGAEQIEREGGETMRQRPVRRPVRIERRTTNHRTITGAIELLGGMARRRNRVQRQEESGTTDEKEKVRPDTGARHYDTSSDSCVLVTRNIGGGIDDG